MWAPVTAAWPLFFGIALIMLGNGLQGTLLGLRANLEGFDTEVTGLVMSFYYAGFLAGSIVAPHIVGRVGHIRVFAALASLSSASVLLHAVFVDPITWGLVRIVTGFSYAGLFVVAESWLNGRATNETRGKLLSIYMVITLGGMASGQFLLNLGDPGSFELFVLVSVLVSISLLPILLTVRPAPAFEAPKRVGLRELYRVSPLGLVGATLTGLAHGAFFGMGAVYAIGVGLSLAEVSLFMSAGMLGGVVLQWPIGSLSDRFDRRRVLTGVTTVAVLAALATLLPWANETWTRIALVALYGGMALPMYSLCIAHTNDFLAPEELVSASAGLVLMAGAGAIFGPAGAALAMAALGDAGFFLFLAAVHAAVALFAAYRMTRRDTVPAEARGSFVAMPVRASPIAAGLSPQAEDEALDEPD